LHQRFERQIAGPSPLVLNQRINRKFVPESLEQQIPAKGSDSIGGSALGCSPEPPTRDVPRGETQDCKPEAEKERGESGVHRGCLFSALLFSNSWLLVVNLRFGGGSKTQTVAIGAANLFRKYPVSCHFSNVVPGGKESYHD
jgi:hypothetical protein